MKADEAKRRYDLRLAKEDQWYIYIEIYPKSPADRADFQRARLVLLASSFLPRELWFEQNNLNEVRWDIPQIQSGVGLNRADFAQPAVPAGWTLERIPRQDAPQRQNVPPRVIRPNR